MNKPTPEQEKEFQNGFDKTMMVLHDHSMSKDDIDACTGRLSKIYFQAQVQAFKDEIDRGTDMILVAGAHVTPVVKTMFSALNLSGIDKKSCLDLVDILNDEIRRQINESNIPDA